MDYMFKYDSKLTTIYVSEKWNTSKVSYSSKMFYECNALVGGTGTVYRSDITDNTYAVIDDRDHGQYGYLTDIKLKKTDSTITTTNINGTNTATTSVTTTTTTTTTPVAIRYGDVNGDKIADAVDASLVLRHYALTSTSDENDFSKEQETAANVNMDDYVDSSDASLILKYYAYSSITDKPVSIEEYLNINKTATTTSTAKITTTTTTAKPPVQS
jgi:hypothetical protein